LLLEETRTELSQQLPKAFTLEMLFLIKYNALHHKNRNT